MKKIYTQPRTETVATTPQQILCASGGIQAQISGYKQDTGGGFIQPVIMGIVCSSLLFLGTACRTTNNPDQPKQQAELKPRTLIVTEVESQKSKVERRLPQATITENGDVLDALWDAGDEVFYRNLSYSYDYYDDDEDESHSLSGTLRADKDGSVASFSGEQVWCAEENQLALIYPKIDESAMNVSLVESQLTASYTISVAEQDGSLATLANKYHHIYGIASVVSVTETTANAELAEMKSLMTVCKFSFEDKNVPGTSLPITSLQIKKGGTGSPYIGTYPQEGTVYIAQSTLAWNVSVDPEWETPAAGGKPLTITTPIGTPPTEVYVALFPDMGATYSFTVTSGGNTYTGEATATLNEGEYVVAPLKLTKNN